jgi:hypothetical protein
MPNEERLPTYPLDDAMKELLDLFNQCSNKTIDQKEQSTTCHSFERIQDAKSRSPHSNVDDSHSYVMTNRAKMTKSEKETSHTTERAKTETFQTSDRGDGDFSSQKMGGSQTIEQLQQRQSELQNQLDDALKVAEELELKKKRKLNGLAEERLSDSNDGYDDMELIEFHQIEIELRVSELNRQLTNIQEDLRLRLYKRLQSKTLGNHANRPQDFQKHPSNNNQREQSSLRRNSTLTDESTPPSSSCSDETTATSTTDMMTHSSTKNSIDSELAQQLERCDLSKVANEEFNSRGLQSTTKSNNSDHFEQKDAPNLTERMETHSTGENKNTEKTDLDLAFAQSHNYEVIPSTLDNKQRNTSHSSFRTPSRIPTMSSFSRKPGSNDQIDQQHQRSFVGESAARSIDNQTASDGYRNCPANNDLERIEEGEEDDVDYYCNAEKFRSIYEEKISPMLQVSEIDVGQPARESQQQLPLHLRSDQQFSRSSKTPARQIETANASAYATPKPNQDNRFNINNINSSKRGNRPLTIYLPRPDEDLDLVETIQSLGHDLNILSSDLKITPISAQGYLYKSCSNNSKKWLKRYFHFNRESKILSYFENEEQLVKKINSPKCTIPFEEISDVYVDHRLSEKQKSATRKSYVFVLATIKRKYLLASSKAETMRAWIDILFTAAKANDYFQQIENNEESLSFNYDSFKED